MHDLLGVYFSKETNSSCWQIFNAIQKNFFEQLKVMKTMKNIIIQII